MALLGLPRRSNFGLAIPLLPLCSTGLFIARLRNIVKRKDGRLAPVFSFATYLPTYLSLVSSFLFYAPLFRPYAIDLNDKNTYV
jgi:hypothetical protein